MLAFARVAGRRGVQRVEVPVKAVIGREAFQAARIDRGQADEIGPVGHLAEVDDRILLGRGLGRRLGEDIDEARVASQQNAV